MKYYIIYPHDRNISVLTEAKLGTKIKNKAINCSLGQRGGRVFYHDLKTQQKQRHEET